MKHSFQTVYTLWLREMLRFKRSKSRIIGAVATPLFFLVIIGSALNTTVSVRSGSYIDHMTPGIIWMSILYSSLMGGVSNIWDRNFGFLKEILIAPVIRLYTELVKASGGLTTAMIKGLCIMLLSEFMVV